MERGYGRTFNWRQGSTEVILGREGNFWHVICTSTSRLFGPPIVMYEGNHRQAKHAAWDFMARVIRVSQDETEGVEVARKAVRWMQDAGIPDDATD